MSASMFRRVALVLVVIGISPIAGAQTTEFSFTPGPGFEAYGDAVNAALSADELTQALEDEIRAIYGATDVAKFLNLSSNAQTLVSSSLGADYSSDPKGLFLGFGATAAFSSRNDRNEDPNSDSELPVSSGVLLSLLVGYNLSEEGYPWLTLSGHALYHPLTVEQLEGEFINFGLRAQARLMEGTLDEGFQALRWGGLLFTTGYSFAQTTLSLSDSFETNTTVDDIGNPVPVTLVSTGVLELTQTAHTLPLEFTTSGTFFEVFSLYGGFGIDIPLGNASTNVDLDTRISSTINGQVEDVGEMRIRVEGEEGSDVIPRFLLGTQLNFWAVKVFAHVNVATLSDPTLSLSGGVKVVF